MGMKSIWCPVLGAHITQVTDLEGTVTRVICTEYDASDGTCRLKKAAVDGGPLAQLLERVSEATLNAHSILCVMRAS